MLTPLHILTYINLYHTLHCYYYYSGLPSVWIPYSANPTVVADALLTIPYITGVSVTFSQPNGPACNPITNLIFVTFTQQFGDLPPLVPLLDATMIATNGYVNVYADGVTGVYDDVHQVTYHSIIGTKESDPCANRGLCFPTGVCIYQPCTYVPYTSYISYYILFTSLCLCIYTRMYRCVSVITPMEMLTGHRMAMA